MDLQDLLEQKSNIFDHVLYEFEMYIETYYKLCENAFVRKVDQVTYNAILESHAIHLRNLIDFFNSERDCISVKTVFEEPDDKSFNDSKYKAKQTVNKAINHLTKERLTWNQTEDDLTLRYSQLISPMFNRVMLPRIAYSVNLLIAGQKIKKEYRDMCKDADIQQRLLSLKMVSDKQCEEVL